jgi:pimeloyl-ACP methyl ester carboxylesterase
MRRAMLRDVAILSGALLLAGCYVPGRPIESAKVLLDIVASGEESALKRERPPVAVEVVQYAVDGRLHSGDLYRSGEDWLAAMILVPGVAEEGKDDPRLVQLAMSLARARFAVLVPDMPNVRQLRVGPRDIRDIADAAVWLAGQTELARSGKVGIAAASYAVGPAILASLEPDAADRIRFILGIGGFFDLESSITFLTTGCFRLPDGAWECREPNDYSKWVFVLSNLERIADPGDRDRLERIALRRLESPGMPIPSTAIDLMNREGAAILRLLVNEDPQAAPRLLAQLPEAIRRDWEQLSPSTADLSRLQARLLLIHGRDDDMVPYTESVALAEVAPWARLFLLDGLMHVDLENVEWIDGLRMWNAIGALLAERSGPPEGPRRPRRPADRR